MPVVTQAVPNWPVAGAPTDGPAPSANLIALCAYYVSRLIVQFNGKPNATRLIALFAKKILCDDLATAVLNAYNLQTAVGPQLDVLGKYIGVGRDINPAVQPNLFSFVDYNGANPQGKNGWALYDGSSEADGAFLSYTSSGVPTTNLTDDQYAFVLQLKIGLNMQDGTLAQIQQFIATFLPGFVSVVDNQNMTLTYNVNVNVPISVPLIEEFLPKPMGVGINVIETFERIVFSGSTRIVADGDIRVTV